MRWRAGRTMLNRSRGTTTTVTTALLLVLTPLGGGRRRLAPGQDNIVEVNARRAGDVDLPDHFEAKDAKRPPGQVSLIAGRQPDGKEHELGADRRSRIELSCNEHVDVEVAEPLDADRL